MRYEEALDLLRIRVFVCTTYVTRDKKEIEFVQDKMLDSRSVMGCSVGILEDGCDFQGQL